MKTRMLSVAALIVTISVHAAEISTQSLSGSPAAVSIDGIACGGLRQWAGGDARATVVDVSGAKHLGSVTFDALTLQFALPPPAPVAAWISDLCASRYTRKTVRVTEYDLAGTPRRSIEARNALLTEVRFPALDAAAGGAASVVLVIAAEQVVTAPPLPLGTAASAGRPADAAHFRLTIEGLRGIPAIRIDPITVTQAVATEVVGAQRDYAKEPGAVQFSNLTFTLADAAAAELKDWFDRFAVKGANSDAEEKQAAIELTDATGRDAVFGLQFSHAGIVRVTYLPAAGTAIDRDQVELYFEGLAVGMAAGGAPAPAPAGGPPPPADTGATVDSRTAALADRSVAAGGLNPAASAVASAAGAANPADLGTRDPVDFPRVPGLTRLYYSGTFQPTYTSETAEYTSTDDAAQLMKRITDAARSAGWDQSTLEEQGAPPGRTFSAGFNKPPATAQVTCRDRQGGGTTVDVQVYKQKPPPN